LQDDDAGDEIDLDNLLGQIADSFDCINNDSSVSGGAIDIGENESNCFFFIRLVENFIFFAKSGKMGVTKILFLKNTSKKNSDSDFTQNVTERICNIVYDNVDTIGIFKGFLLVVLFT
jgi:hypothetical protein